MGVGGPGPAVIALIKIHHILNLLLELFIVLWENLKKVVEKESSGMLRVVLASLTSNIVRVSLIVPGRITNVSALLLPLIQHPPPSLILLLQLSQLPAH